MIPLSRFVAVASRTITRTYCIANRSAWCFVKPDAQPLVTPVAIWFPLTTGQDRAGNRVMVREAVAAKYQEELDEKLGSLFRQYVRANNGDTRSVPTRLVSFTRSPFGVQIPNPDPPEIVPWKPVAGTSADRLPVGIAYDAYGEMVEWWDRKEDTHAIIAGATGSGKSKAIQSLVAHMVATESPEDLEIVPVDLKRRALTALESAPHVRVPLAYTKEAAVAMLMALDAEQNRRIEELVETPVIALVMDELTDVLEGDDEAKSAFSRIARKGRELGIFILAGTQKPMLTELGQGNTQLTYRVVGRMKTDRDAKLVGGEEIDASRLRHAGSFYVVNGRGEPASVRVPFLSDAQFAKVMTDAALQWPNPSPSVLVLPEVEQGATGRAIAKAAEVQAQAEADLERLLDEFGNEFEEVSMTRKIESLGVKAVGNNWKKGKKRVEVATELFYQRETA